MINKFEKFLTKWAIKIFHDDYFEKKIKVVNERIGDLVYELIIKRDEYATKNDVIFTPAGFKKNNKKG